ncbi:MAG: hypothetical protein ACOZBZ_03080 [Patescibacteria group bacterium]
MSRVRSKEGGEGYPNPLTQPENRRLEGEFIRYAPKRLQGILTELSQIEVGDSNAPKKIDALMENLKKGKDPRALQQLSEELENLVSSPPLVPVFPKFVPLPIPIPLGAKIIYFSFCLRLLIDK